MEMVVDFHRITNAAKDKFHNIQVHETHELQCVALLRLISSAAVARPALHLDP